MNSSCDKCADLRETFEIRTPGDLQKAARVALANIEDDTIKEIPGGQAFSQLVKAFEPEGVWPDDFVEYDFECLACGQRFRLSAETYHGSSGSWRPIEGDGR